MLATTVVDSYPQPDWLIVNRQRCLDSTPRVGVRSLLLNTEIGLNV